MDFALPIASEALTGKTIELVHFASESDVQEHLKAETSDSKQLHVSALNNLIDDEARSYASVSVSGRTITFANGHSGATIVLFSWQ